MKYDKYNKIPSIQSHQGWTYLYWEFKTRKEALKKIAQFKSKYPKITPFVVITENIIWINSTIDSGRKDYTLAMSLNNSDIARMIGL